LVQITWQAEATTQFTDTLVMTTRAHTLLRDMDDAVAAAGSSGGGCSDAKAGRFEWVDGPLLTAVEQGGWVLLEHANLCNPAVLDRLNPLLEPGGTLLVSECGLRGGAPRVVRAHRNFRLMLALDPAVGEVSRAMRNRGIELFLLPEPQQQPHSSSSLPTDVATDGAMESANPSTTSLQLQLQSQGAHPSPLNSDAELLLAAAGLPRGAASLTVLAAMRGVADAARAGGSGRRAALGGAGEVPLRQMTHCVGLWTALVERGAPARAALVAAWSHTVVAASATPAAAATAVDALHLALQRHAALDDDDVDR
jgi:hypothetical protein